MQRILLFEYSDSTKFNEIHYFDSKWDHEDGRNTVLFLYLWVSVTVIPRRKCRSC